jgi:GNAT superfamily N-acetyltransferase
MSENENYREARGAPETVRLLSNADIPALYALAECDPIRFMTARINAEVHGFEGKLVRAWGSFDSGGQMHGVLLRFSNTAVVMDCDGASGTLFADVIDRERGIAGIRGCMETMQTVQPALRRYTSSDLEESRFMRLSFPPCCSPERLSRARRATLADLDKLAQLYAGAGIMYRSRANVAARLERERVFVVEEQPAGRRPSRVVACALLNVEGAEVGIIGGVYTLPEARGKGYASACTAALALDLQRDGKLPCLFYENPVAGRVYRNLGFEEIGLWGILYLHPARRPGYF